MRRFYDILGDNYITYFFEVTKLIYDEKCLQCITDIYYMNRDRSTEFCSCFGFKVLNTCMCVNKFDFNIRTDLCYHDNTYLRIIGGLNLR